MADQPALTIAVGFRDRDAGRVGRFLDSLHAQTLRGFELIFVDYGSAAHTSREIRGLVERYAFVRYVYSDTRGHPWSRARALNIGGRMATAPYLMTTDVDMVFPPHFLAEMVAHADASRVLYCYPLFLPKRFDDWEHLEQYVGRIPEGNHSAMGGCQCLAAAVFQQMRGFDEFYRYWGAEDRDLNHRFKLLGLEEHWLNEDGLHFFHQWHPIINHQTPDFMPEGLWGRIQLHTLHHRETLVRNAEDWGHVSATEERAALRFVDLEARRVLESDELEWFDAPPDSQQALGQLVACFEKLPAGHALAVPHAFYPAHTRWADRIVRYGNRWLRRGGAKTRLDYAHNVLHAFTVELIEQNPAMVADYFLNFPALDGVTVLVRA